MRTTIALVLGFAGAIAAAAAPEQIHIAFAGTNDDGHPDGMRVAWFTADEQDSMVQYGTASGSLDRNATGDAAVQYLEDNGFHHVVKISGFAPATRVYYRVGSSAGGWSEEHSFTTAPAAGSSDFAISVFGDMGWLDSDQRPMVIATAGLVKHWSATVTRDRLEALKNANQFDFLWHLGDIGYADDAFAHHPLGFYYETAFNGFVNWMQNISATMPYMVSPGNHESECHSPNCILSGHAKKLANFTAYNARYHMPSAESGGHEKSAMWYSWNYANVHFVSVNSETDWDGAEEHDTGDSHDKSLPAGHFGADGEYMAWLENDLKAASEARARAQRGENGGAWAPTFIVAGGHRPYGFSKEHQALFAKYGVDLHLSGHGHSYTRGAPVNGTTYIMAGGAGCDEMDYLESPIAREHGVGVDWEAVAKPPRAGTAPSGEGFTSVFASRRIASGILRVNATAMHFDLIDSHDGSVVDQVDISAEEQRESRAAFAARYGLAL